MDRSQHADRPEATVHRDDVRVFATEHEAMREIDVFGHLLPSRAHFDLEDDD
jgi:hypothetical protein